VRVAPLLDRDLHYLVSRENRMPFFVQVVMKKIGTLS
jgi:hypothetical protein